MSVQDRNGSNLNVGDMVAVFSIIRKCPTEETNKNDLVGHGRIKSLSGMHGTPDSPMVWVTGIRSCHHPCAVELTNENDN